MAVMQRLEIDAEGANDDLYGWDEPSYDECFQCLTMCLNQIYFKPVKPTCLLQVTEVKIILPTRSWGYDTSEPPNAMLVQSMARSMPLITSLSLSLDEDRTIKYTQISLMEMEIEWEEAPPDLIFDLDLAIDMFSPFSDPAFQIKELSILGDVWDTWEVTKGPLASSLVLQSFLISADQISQLHCLRLLDLSTFTFDDEGSILALFSLQSLTSLKVYRLKPTSTIYLPNGMKSSLESLATMHQMTQELDFLTLSLHSSIKISWRWPAV